MAKQRKHWRNANLYVGAKSGRYEFSLRKLLLCCSLHTRQYLSSICRVEMMALRNPTLTGMWSRKREVIKDIKKKTNFFSCRANVYITCGKILFFLCYWSLRKHAFPYPGFLTCILPKQLSSMHGEMIRCKMIIK